MMSIPTNPLICYTKSMETVPLEQLESRPKLTNPKEFDIIRKIHFEDHRARGADISDIDPLELNDRMNHRPNRNQSR